MGLENVFRWNPRTGNRSGVVGFIVLVLLSCAGLLVFAMSRFKSGAIEQLAKTIDQNILLSFAEAGCDETLAILKTQANGSAGVIPAIGQDLRQVAKSKPAGLFTKVWRFSPDQLCYSNTLARQTTGGQIKVSSQVTLVLNAVPGKGLIPTPIPSYGGYLEIVSQALQEKNSKNSVEVKERRDIVILNLRDFFDRYILYVKNYCWDLNNSQFPLILEGMPGNSTIYLGNRFYPANNKEFNGNAEKAPVLLDFDFQNDRIVTQTILEKFLGGTGGTPCFSPDVFWGSAKLSFAPFFKAGYQKEDFFPVPEVRNLYLKIVEIAKGLNTGNSVSAVTPIITDFQSAGGDPSKSTVFAQMVQSCGEGWTYQYGYTDASHIWVDGNKIYKGPLSLNPVHSGMVSYREEVAGFNSTRQNTGKMARLFGENRQKVLPIEGNVFFRFYKVAFFEGFTKDIVAGFPPLSIPSIPLTYQNPLSKSFLNKPAISDGIENCLMSRPVDDFPAIRLLSHKDAVPILKPGEDKGNGNKPEDNFPTLYSSAFSHWYKSGEDFIRDRTFISDTGEPTLDIDGQAYIEKGNVDLSAIRKFRGQGTIYLGFRGDFLIGTLKKSNPADSLRFFAQDGSIIIKSPDEGVRVEASLIATTFLPRNSKRKPNHVDNQGKLVPNGKNVEIYGNLVVDYLYTESDKGTKNGIPLGGYLRVIHDPVIFSPVDEYRISIGKIRTMVAVNSGNPSLAF